MRLTTIFAIALCFATLPAQAIEYPLTVSPDGRNILDARGDVVVFNAETPWHLAARLTREEVTDYLEARRAQGFNALLMALMVTDGYSSGSTANAYGDHPFRTPGDFSKPDEAYFAHVDWVIEQARQYGMTMFITPLYLGYDCGDEGWCAEAIAQGTTRVRDFGRWVGNRYVNQPNIVWVAGGDVDAWAWGAGEETEAMVAGIREVDTTHLWTAHCSRQNSGRDCYEAPWMDFDTTYSDCTASPVRIRSDYQRVPWMPTVYVEGIYEFERSVSGQCLRSQAWWAALGGQVGQFFGSGLIWDFPGNWRDGLDTEGTRSMDVLGTILEARGWGSFVPDYSHQAMVAGYGNIDDASYAATATRLDRNSVLAYIPTPRTVTMDMGRLNGSFVDAWWVDPETGDGELIGRFLPSGTRQFTTPGTGDWLLVLDNVDAAFVDPWANATAVGDAPGAMPVSVVSASPNPFNPRTVLSFSGPVGVTLHAAIYDARGRLVETVFDGEATGSVQSLTWEPRNLASGSYFFRVSGNGETSVRKVTLLK